MTLAPPTATIPPPTATEEPTLAPTPTNTPILTPRPTLDANLGRGPYLQSITSSSVIVAWQTGKAYPGAVAYGETETYGQLVPDPQVDTRHAITLTGLSPYTLYHYQVQVGDASLGGDYTFRTAAGPDQTNFTFAAFGDTRSQPESHRAVVERILGWEPDFALHTGDLVGDGSVYHWWQTFFEIERELMARVPLFPALGNHEMDSPLYRELFYLPGNERWYSFDYGQAHFICLQVDGFANLDPEGEQVRWLRADLAKIDRPWKFAFFHIPPYSSLFYPLEGAGEAQARRVLTPILVEHGVQLVFTGHHHNYQRYFVDGVTYVVTGGGGAPLYTFDEPDPELITYAFEYHAVLVSLEGSTLTAVVISTEGEELDRFRLELQR